MSGLDRFSPMPPKKAPAQKLTHFFAPVEGGSPLSLPEDLPEMALTKDDLLSSLRDFKRELREELKMDLASSLDLLRSDLNLKLQEVQRDLDSVGTRTMDLEKRLQDTVQKATTSAELTSSLMEQMEMTSLKCEDLENRLRRDNIRIRGLEENVEGPDLEAFVTGLFQEIMGDSAMEVNIDRAHRVGPPAVSTRKKPRDILVKLTSFKVKENILRKARQNDNVSFQGHSCSLYQDIAPATLARRHQLRPITEKLRVDGIRYRWTYLFGISFELSGKSHHALNAEEAAKILGIILESDLQGETNPQNRHPDGEEGKGIKSNWLRQGRKRGLRPR